MHKKSVKSKPSIYSEREWQKKAFLRRIANEAKNKIGE